MTIPPSDKPSPPPRCRIAVLQSNSILYDVQANITVISEALQALQNNDEQNVELLVCPELFLVGYELAQHDNRNATALRKSSFAQDSPTMQQLRDLAKQHRVAISTGYAELSDGETDTKGNAVIYNSSILLDHKGNTVLNYRKTHLWWLDERAAFKPGSQLLVADMPLRNGDSLRVGAIICYDIEFPENARICALNGCELLLMPTCLVVQDFVIPLITIRSRGHENHMFLAYSNLVGRTKLQYSSDDKSNSASDEQKADTELSKNNFIGLSAIIDPAGGECARAPISETVKHQLPKDLVYPFDHRAKRHANSRTIPLQTSVSTGTDAPCLIVSDINTAAYEGAFNDVDYLLDRRHELFDRMITPADKHAKDKLLNGHSATNGTATVVATTSEQ